MREWFSALEIAAAAREGSVEEFPLTKRRVTDLAARESWLSRERKGKGGGLEYALSALPRAVQKALAAAELAKHSPLPTAGPGQTGTETVRSKSPSASTLGTLARALPRGAGFFPGPEGDGPALEKAQIREAELPGPRSQAELGNEGNEGDEGKAIYHDPLKEKRGGDAWDKYEALKPLLDIPKSLRGPAVKALAQRLGVHFSTLYRQLERYEEGGVTGLAKARRSDVGEARADISLQFDRLSPLPHAVLADIRTELDAYIGSCWGAGVTGWRQVQALAGVELHRLCQARGWRVALEDCRVPRHVVDAKKHLKIVHQAKTDAKGTYDKHMPNVKRHKRGLMPWELVYGDVHPLDIPVRIEGRGLVYPKLIAWLCVGTGQAVGYPVLCGPNQGVTRADVAQSFAHLCEQFSIPDRAIGLDNGSEFNWDCMVAGYAELARLTGKARFDIQGAKAVLHEGKGGKPVLRKLPYNSKSSPCEGFFSVLENAYLCQIPGWVGGNRITKKTQNLGKEPAGFPGGDWLELCRQVGVCFDLYNNRPGADGLSPNQRLNRARELWGWRPAQADAAAVLLSFAEADVRTVKAGRLTWNGLSYYDDRLLGVNGRRLVKVAGHDPRLAFVFERADGGRLECVAALEPSYGFLDKTGAKERGRRLKAFKQVLRDYGKQVFPLVPMVEQLRWLDAFREDADYGGAIMVQLSEEARAMRAAVDREAEALAGRFERKPQADILSQWGEEDDPEILELRRSLGE